MSLDVEGPPVVIDAHAHLHGAELDPGVEEECEAHGVDRIVVSSIANFRAFPSFEQVRQANADLLAVRQRRPDLVECYCYVNPRHGAEGLADLRRNIAEGMVGIKLWIATTADDPRVDPFVELAVEHRMPILMHAWRKTVGQGPYETTAAHIASIAARHPDARIIMAHLGGQVESAMTTIAPYANVLTDTSGTLNSSGAVRMAVERLGPERVVFGSDMHGNCLAHNIGKVVSADLPAEDAALVMGGTMQRLLAEVRR
ncbi:amidohydrolase family protein [Parenemella sanctibonifatiensis]|uniref:amidohydrolase family protein n=1 Tax=Parenemella sanctibonifatiensis TaxID=2016505 RepID=UPI0015C5E944|nr:amidohydrolase family protein [Parenemella sanctibonifatiensis]